jgi:hypothetical protein
LSESYYYFGIFTLCYKLRQQGSKAARQQGSKAAGQQGSKAAGQQGSRAAGQQGSKAAGTAEGCEAGWGKGCKGKEGKGTGYWDLEGGVDHYEAGMIESTVSFNTRIDYQSICRSK